MAKKAKSKLSEWQERAQKGGICEKCKRVVSVLSVDHIVPVAILDVLDDTGEMKYEFEENFKLVCFPCNRFKAGRLDKSDTKTVSILMKLLTNSQ